MTLTELINVLRDIRNDLHAHSPRVKIRNVNVIILNGSEAAKSPNDAYIFYGDNDTIEVRIE